MAATMKTWVTAGMSSAGRPMALWMATPAAGNVKLDTRKYQGSADAGRCTRTASRTKPAPSTAKINDGTPYPCRGRSSSRAKRTTASTAIATLMCTLRPNIPDPRFRYPRGRPKRRADRGISDRHVRNRPKWPAAERFHAEMAPTGGPPIARTDGAPKTRTAEFPTSCGASGQRRRSRRSPAWTTTGANSPYT